MSATAFQDTGVSKCFIGCAVITLFIIWRQLGTKAVSKHMQCCALRSATSTQAITSFLMIRWALHMHSVQCDAAPGVLCPVDSWICPDHDTCTQGCAGLSLMLYREAVPPTAPCCAGWSSVLRVLHSDCCTCLWQYRSDYA